MTLTASKERFYLKLQAVGATGSSYYDSESQIDRQAVYVKNVSFLLRNVIILDPLLCGQ